MTLRGVKFANGALFQGDCRDVLTHFKDNAFDACAPLGRYECAEDADALVIVTEWEQFRALDLNLLRQVMARPVVVDLRKLYCSEDMARHGFVDLSIGTAIETPGSRGIKFKDGIDVTKMPTHHAA